MSVVGAPVIVDDFDGDPGLEVVTVTFEQLDETTDRGSPPVARQTADVTRNDAIDLSDAILLLEKLFRL